MTNSSYNLQTNSNVKIKFCTCFISDPKFAAKVRMLGCVRTMHLVLKGHFTDNKLIFPLLVIMKQLAKNGKFLFCNDTN